GAGVPVPEAWTAAVDRSGRFLAAHQNPGDGALPNYGANDGSMFAILSSCAFSDFRPSLQIAAIATRGERLYERGTWDGSSVWLFGAGPLESPQARLRHGAVSSARPGYHAR